MPDLPNNPTLPEVDDADRVVGLIARLPHESIVRRLGMQVVQGRPIDSIEPLTASLQRPGFRRWREQKIAAWALGRTTVPEQDREQVVQRLLDTLDGVYRENWANRLGRGAGWTSCVVFSFVLVLMLFGDMRSIGRVDDMLPILAMMHVMFGMGVIPATLRHSNVTDAHVRAEAAVSLGRLSSVDAIGTLAGAVHDRNDEVRTAAARALHQLLPLVTFEHFGTFGTVAIENLGRVLFHQDGQLVFKALAALERVGTSAAIPFVQRARDRGRTQRVQDAAGAVLQVLLDRKHHETQRDQLLRPSDGLHDSAVLLRAPTSSSSEDHSVLLQPASDGG